MIPLKPCCCRSQLLLIKNSKESQINKTESLPYDSMLTSLMEDIEA